jgi:uncharacterized protein YjbI with pentapeptide repeats
MPARRSSTGAVEAPRIDEFDLPDLTEGVAEELVERESYDSQRFAAADVSGYDLEGVSFRECLLESLTLGGTKLRGGRFVESVVTDSFAPELSAARTTWRDVRVERPRWGSAELFDSGLESVTIRGGKIDYLNLRGSKLTDVIIDSCNIGELDLGGVAARRVSLIDCRLGTLDVTRAELNSVDLRSTSFDAVTGIEGLRGAVIDDGQLSLLAPLFAAQLGLVVR